MAKKDFSNDAASVFVDKMVTPAPAAPKPARSTPTPKNYRQRTNAAQTEVKVTFMLRKDMDAKMRYVCFAERFKQKDVIDAALRAYFADYEKKHGKIADDETI